VAVLQSYKEKKIKEKQAADADAAGFRDSQVFLNTTLRTEIKISRPQLPKNSCLWQVPTTCLMWPPP